MNVMTTSFLSANTKIEAEKDEHFDRIYALRKACEIEMFAYIEKFILDGRRLGEVFPVAHQSVLDDVSKEGCVYGHYVLEHIIANEELFKDKDYVLQGYKAMFNEGPETRLERIQ